MKFTKLTFWRQPSRAKASASWRQIFSRLTILALFFVGLFLMLFFSAGNILVRDDSTKGQANVAVILMGDLIPRSDLAADLLSKKLVKKILFFRPMESSLSRAGLTKNEGELTLRYLLSKGLNRDDIEYVTSTLNSSTREESAEILRWAKQQSTPPENLAICTSWYHTSRAGWIIDREFSGQNISVHMHPAFSPEGKPSAWWHSEESFLAVFTEYLKWIYYLARYGAE